MKNKLLLSFFLLFSFSCSILMNEKKEFETKELTLLDKKLTPHFCEKKSTIELIGPSAENIKTFFPFLQDTRKTPEEKFLLWVLLNARLRPDKISEQSEIKFFKIKKDIVSYKHFKGEKTLSHFLYTLNPKFEILDSLLSTYRSPLFVDEELENFLENNKGELWARPNTKELFFKDEQTLKKGESLTTLRPKLSSSKLLKTEDLTLLNSSFCDFDLKRYEGLPEKIIPIAENEHSPLLIGLSTSDEHYVAIIDQTIDWKNTANEKNLFEANIRPPSTLAPFCIFSQEESKVLVIARQTRDPAQLLKILSEKVSKNSYTKKDLDSFLNTQRKIVLHHPTRILIELKDAPTDPLRFSKKFPIYTQDRIGQIDALLFGTKKDQGFVIDERAKEALLCR